MDNENVDQTNSENLRKRELREKINDLYYHKFLCTGFSERYTEFINNLRVDRLWGVIGAFTRNGKSWSLLDIVRNSERYKNHDGNTYFPVLVVQAPSSNTINGNDLYASIRRGFGYTGSLTALNCKDWLIDVIPKVGLEQIIFDDAHELSNNHLRVIKDLTDELILQKNHHLSIVLSSVIDFNEILVWRKICAYSNEAWMKQLYERFKAFKIVHGLTIDEVAQVLRDYEVLYSEVFSKIELTGYTSDIFTWLTCSLIDDFNCERVAMDHLAFTIYESAKIACLEYNMDNIPLGLIKNVIDNKLIYKKTVSTITTEKKYTPKKNTEERRVKNEQVKKHEENVI